MAFKDPGPFTSFIALLEEYGIVQPINWKAWNFNEAMDMHFAPIPDWVVNGLVIVILAYSLIQLRFIG